MLSETSTARTSAISTTGWAPAVPVAAAISSAAKNVVRPLVPTIGSLPPSSSGKAAARCQRGIFDPPAPSQQRQIEQGEDESDAPDAEGEGQQRDLADHDEIV